MPVSKEELDRIAIEYHGSDLMKDKYIEDECQFYTYNWVFGQLQGCKDILELGYGEGNFTEALVENGYCPTIIDGSRILLDKAKLKYQEKIETVESLFEDFNPTKKFDCIMATHVLEHVDEPVTLLRKMKDWIKPSGKVIIIVPNKESLHRRLAVIMNLQTELDFLGERDKLVGHQRVYSIKSLSNDVNLAGLKVKETEGFFLKTLPNSMMLGFSRDLIIALNKISPVIPKEMLANIGMVATK